MSHKSFTRLRAISIGILIIGAVSAGLAYSLRKPDSPNFRPRKGFTLKSRTTSMLTIPRPPIAGEITHSSSTRYQRSDGTFKEIQTYFGANDVVMKKTILFGIPGQGVFTLTNPKGPLEFLSPMEPKEKASFWRIYDGHKHPNYLKDDWVKGYQTYVARFPDDDGGYHDIYVAPELDGEPLRSVSVSPGGVSISEVVQITLGDPDDRVFGPLPNLVVGYNFFREKIATMEERGQHKTVEALRRQLSEQIAKEMNDQ